MKIDDIDVDNFLNFLQKEAAKKRENSALSGDFHDGGASDLEKQIDIFVSGLNKNFPEIWNHYIKEYNKENDPEYQEYLKLKKKFE